MEEFRLTLNDTTIKFSTDFKSYAAYFKSYFEQVIHADKDSKPDIDITFHWTDVSFKKVLNESANVNRRKVGANTYLEKNRVITVKKIERKWKLLFDIQKKEGRLSLNIYLQKKPLKDFFRYGRFAGEQHEWFFNATYYFLYYPLFWYLALNKNMHPLHASAFEYQEKGIVVCGLEGIGKTSLGLKFLNEEGAKFLSDNLIFADDTSVYSCYELVRMHAEDDPNLWKGKFEQINSFNILKGFFRPLFKPENKGIKTDYVIFPEFGGSFSVEEISRQEAVQRSIVLSYLPSELNRYLEFKYVFDLLNLEGNVQSDQNTVLTSTYKNAKCLRVIMNKDDGLDMNFDRMKGLL